MKNLYVISVLVFLLIGFSVEAKLYKWTDENGKVHYSDKMPPDQIKNAHEKLSDQGLVKEKVERELTDEEKATPQVNEYDLRQMVIQLNKRVEMLEKRVAELEKR